MYLIFFCSVQNVVGQNVLTFSNENCKGLMNKISSKPNNRTPNYNYIYVTSGNTEITLKYLYITLVTSCPNGKHRSPLGQRRCHCPR